MQCLQGSDCLPGLSIVTLSLTGFHSASSHANNLNYVRD